MAPRAMTAIVMRLPDPRLKRSPRPPRLLRPLRPPPPRRSFRGMVRKGTVKVRPSWKKRHC